MPFDEGGSRRDRHRRSWERVFRLTNRVAACVTRDFDYCLTERMCATSAFACSAVMPFSPYAGMNGGFSPLTPFIIDSVNCSSVFDGSKFFEAVAVWHMTHLALKVPPASKSSPAARVRDVVAFIII